MNRTSLQVVSWLVALALLGWFYLQSSQTDAGLHTRTVQHFEQLHQQDARLNQFVLQARYGQLKNYDPIVAANQQIQTLLLTIGRDKPDLFIEGDSDVQSAYARLTTLFKQKADLVEAFKSRNSVLRNSFSYLPVAVKMQLERAGSNPRQEQNLHDLLESVLLYNQGPTEALEGQIRRDLGALVEVTAGDEAIHELAKHISIILSYKPEVDELTRQITLAGTGAQGDELLHQYGEEFTQREYRSSSYKLAMALLSFAMLCYAAWAMYNLAKARNILRDSLRELEFQKFALDQHSIVSIADRGGKILYTNGKFTEISQYAAEELKGQDHRILNSGHHPSEFFKEMWQTISQGHVWHGEVKNRRKDGSYYWVDSTIVPFMDEHGEPLRYVSIRTDITERKQAERDMLHAKEAAEEANRSKSDFLANMSHEIRTPMNGIIGMTELALDTDLNDEQREFLGLVKNSADNLLTIVNDILDFSKIEAGKMGIENIEFCLPEMLSQTMRTIALRAHQKGLELVLDIDPAIQQMLIGDPGRLRQVILNLIGNAIKFTEQGEVVVRASLRDVDTASHLVSLDLSVSDTGIGIPADKQQAIFESFSQADTSTTRKYGGTGLGLTISTRLVALMQGNIRVESEVGKGSTFHVEVALEKGGAAIKPKFEAGKLADMKVLVVDDNATNREIAMKLLQGWKMKPHAVESSEQAIAELDRASAAGQDYQLLLLDVRMPTTDGFGVVEHLRSHPALTAAPIMMLTSEGQRGDAARCRELGVGAYMLKPFAQGDLFAAIMNTLGVEAVDKVPLVTRHTIEQNKRSLRVLLAEDNSINQALVTRLLQKFGHKVDVAANGVIAVEKWRAATYDLILMDVDMPELNGYGATAQIRQAESHSGRRIPIIGLTAHAIQGAREECIAHGMDGYLTKPIDTEALWVELEGVGTAGDAGLEDTMSVMTRAPSHFTFDLPRVMNLMANDQGLFKEMVRIYMQDYPKYLASFGEAIANDDAEQIRYNAHSIKGMLSVFAVEEIVDIARRIEEQAGADHHADHLALVGALRWLEGELNKHVGPQNVALNENKEKHDENSTVTLV
ncbi:MAG: DAHL domain-containing protein [Sideroxydans sp.]|jgi:PAS domain S-box-containing protein